MSDPLGVLDHVTDRLRAAVEEVLGDTPTLTQRRSVINALKQIAEHQEFQFELQRRDKQRVLAERRARRAAKKQD